jgi:hypothetical protein
MSDGVKTRIIMRGGIESLSWMAMNRFIYESVKTCNESVTVLILLPPHLAHLMQLLDVNFGTCHEFMRPLAVDVPISTKQSLSIHCIGFVLAHLYLSQFLVDSAKLV